MGRVTGHIMNGRGLVVLGSLVVVGALASLGRVAGAQSPGLTCGAIPLTVELAEPKTGFTGACFVDQLTYAPQLPTLCYSPKAASVSWGNGHTTCSASADRVVQTYGNGLPLAYDAYKVLLTCMPQTTAGQCPVGTVRTGARSCCDYGTNMTSVDGGHIATGLVNFTAK